MKKTFEMMLNFLLLLMAGLFVGSLVYIQYVTCTNIVAGHPLEFPKSLFLYALFQAAPMVILLITPFILMWKIRHLENPVSSTLSFVFLSLILWLLLLPVSQILLDKAPTKTQEYLSNTNAISGGFFRNINGRSYYFISDENVTEGNCDTIMIFDSSRQDTFGSEEIISTVSESEFAKAASPFNDILFKDTMGDLPKFMLHIASLYSKSVDSAWRHGYISWFCFCSLGFLMASAWTLVRISPWRMINFTFVMVVQIFAILVNTLYYADFFSDARINLLRFFYGQDFSRLGFFHSRMIQLPLVSLNLLAGIIIIVIGIVTNAVKKRR